MKKGRLKLGAKLSDADLEKYLPQLPSNLPQSYIDFLRTHNGANGDLPIQPLYFQLWKIDELIQANQEYEIKQYLPNYFGIGGNGSGELIAINLENQKIVAIPFIIMEEKDAWLIAESFENFERISVSQKKINKSLMILMIGEETLKSAAIRRIKSKALFVSIKK